MPHSQEPSYYEIALTNRQVLGFFVVLLICVVGAFFSGVWLGQKRDADLPTLAQATASPATEDPDGELEALNFFTDSETPPPRVETAPETRQEPSPPPMRTAKRTDTTLLEDVRTEAAPSPSAELPSTRGTAIESPRVAAPESAPVAAAVAGLIVQVFASPNGAQAEKLLAQLQEAGYQAFLSTTRIGGQIMHRVRIGPFEGRSQAEAVKRRVDKAYKVDSYITTNE